MIEAGLVLLVLAALVGLSAIGGLVSLGTLFSIALWLIVAGMVLGVPTGFLYHLQLHRCLAPRGALAPKWWLRPLAQHAALRRDERFAVLFWCALGALGFCVTIFGCVLLATAALRSR